MKIVVAGPRDRRERMYQKLVNEIIESCKERYSKLLIITKSCDQGVGKIIRGICLDEDSRHPRFDMAEVSIRHHLTQELTQSEFISNFDSLNSTLVELGDEFHLIMDDIPKGSMYNLLKRVIEIDAPYAMYLQEELDNGVKIPQKHSERGNLPLPTPLDSDAVKTHGNAV